MIHKRRAIVRANWSVEPLEVRTLMAAGITAAVNSSGVLAITGTDGNDTITVRRKNNVITVDGVNGNFQASAVKSIVVDSKGGTDFVNLDSRRSGIGQQALGISVSVQGSILQEKVRGTDGLDRYFSGLGKSLVSSTTGTTTLVGTEVSWFDTNVQTTTLRNVAKTAFSDKVLSRQDMLNIFQTVSADGTVTAGEFADLKALVNTNDLFVGMDYVQNLAGDVVNGNVANARYQGKTLGNLAANSTGTHLQNLVGKWFLGTDRPVATSSYGTTYTYRTAQGSLFVTPPKYSDVRQGYVGDCYLLATLGEVALKNPNVITSMFIVNGDGTYTVRFYNNGKADYVTVDSALPTDSYGRFVFANLGAYASSSTNTLWVALAEKAYAQMNEVGWLRPGLPGSGVNSYQSISAGYMAYAMTHITGKSASLGNSLLSFNTLVTAFSSGNLVQLASKGATTLSTVVGGHAYAMVGYDLKAQTITLFNPWGINNGTTKPGLITLTWTQIVSNFGYWDRGLVA